MCLNFTAAVYMPFESYLFTYLIICLFIYLLMYFYLLFSGQAVDSVVEMSMELYQACSTVKWIAAMQFVTYNREETHLLE